MYGNANTMVLVDHLDHKGEPVPASTRLSRIIHNLLAEKDNDEISRTSLFRAYNPKARRELLQIIQQLPELSRSDAQLDKYSQKILDAGNDQRKMIYAFAELVGRMRLHDAHEPIRTNYSSDDDSIWRDLFSQLKGQFTSI